MHATGETSTVLVVDDEDGIRLALNRFLSRVGYRVVDLASGTEALETLVTVPADAMVCDIRMPGISGVELISKALAQNPDLAILMVSGVYEPRTVVECMKLGAFDYLLKPVDFEQLELAIAGALRRRQLEIERRDLEQWMKREVEARTQEHEAKCAHLESVTLGVLLALADQAADAASRQVVEVAEAVGRAIDLASTEVDDIRTAARLCNLDAVIRDAPSLHRWKDAVTLLATIRHQEGVIAVLSGQCKRFDAEGVSIPIGARILKAAATYAASGGGEAGRRTLRGQAGHELDPDVVRALETTLT